MSSMLGSGRFWVHDDDMLDEGSSSSGSSGVGALEADLAAASAEDLLSSRVLAMAATRTRHILGLSLAAGRAVSSSTSDSRWERRWSVSWWAQARRSCKLAGKQLRVKENDGRERKTRTKRKREKEKNTDEKKERVGEKREKLERERVKKREREKYGRKKRDARKERRKNAKPKHVYENEVVRLKQRTNLTNFD